MKLLAAGIVFFRRGRGFFLTCTVVPVVFGGALAYQDTGRFQAGLFLLVLAGVCIAHIGVNLSNDYFDFRQGADRDTHGARPYSGGGDAIVRDRVAPEQVKRWFWICFALGLLAGSVVLAWMPPEGRVGVLALMGLGFLGGYFYTAPPLKLAYRGLGELAIFLFLGPAPALGTYAALTGEVRWSVFLLSLPIAGLIALLLLINEFTDAETDREAGKRNLVVRLGRRGARWVYLLLNLFVFASAASLVAAGLAPRAFLIILLAAPLSVRSVSRALRGYRDEGTLRAAQADALRMHLAAGLLCTVGILWGSA